MKLVISNIISRIGISGIPYAITLRWMPQRFTDNYSTLYEPMWTNRSLAHSKLNMSIPKTLNVINKIWYPIMIGVHTEDSVTVEFPTCCEWSSLNDVITWIVSMFITWQRSEEALSSLSWRHSWWRHQMETFSALLAICAGHSPVIGEFPAQRPLTRSFDVFFDLCLNKPLSKQWWG